MSTQRFVIPAILALTAAAGMPAAAKAASYTVHITNFSYAPKELAAKVGDTITFVNDDPEAHTVTEAGGKFDSGPIYYKARWTLRATAAGAYRYYCAPHRFMTGTVVVRP